MNKTRRIRITEIHAKLTALQEELSSIIEDESNAADNVPAHCTRKAEEMEENIAVMDEALNALEIAVTHLETLVN